MPGSRSRSKWTSRIRADEDSKPRNSESDHYRVVGCGWSVRDSVAFCEFFRSTEQTGDAQVEIPNLGNIQRCNTIQPAKISMTQITSINLSPKFILYRRKPDMIRDFMSAASIFPRFEIPPQSLSDFSGLPGMHWICFKTVCLASMRRGMSSDWNSRAVFACYPRPLVRRIKADHSGADLDRCEFS